jgi:hypothetical protein
VTDRDAITIRRPGSEVRFAHGDGRTVLALVTKAEVRADLAVSYEVAWWVGGNRNTAWASAAEVEGVGGFEPLRVGFRAEGGPP